MLELISARASLEKMAIGKEKFNEDEVANISIVLAVHTSNGILDDISDGLRKSLFLHSSESGSKGDLVSSGEWFTVRHPYAKPWESTEAWPGYTATLQFEDLNQTTEQLEMVALRKIQVVPHEAGMVTVRFTLKPEADQVDGALVGRLYDSLGDTIKLDLEPPRADTSNHAFTEFED